MSSRDRQKDGAAKPGWRERKRRETRKRVWETALALFSEHGYDATTLEAIAEEAGISKRTFFHYFKSKEEVLVAWQDDVPDLFRAAILGEPEGETPFEVVRNVLARIPMNLDIDQAVVINRLIRSNEQLRASSLAKYLRLEQAAFEALCERWPAAERRAGLHVVAMMSIGALRLAIDGFADKEGRKPLSELVQEAFANLMAELLHA